MGLFICDKCGCVENTALGFWWSRDSESLWPPEYVGKALCSEHGPTTYKDGEPIGGREFGKWHGVFEKHPPDPKLVAEGCYLNRPKENG